jgi:cytoskeleton protein RodZ
MSEAGESLGGRLKAERERKGFSTQKAADQLHLDAWVIEALESGDYARMGPSVYGKGHLKRYAGLLGLPADEIISAYETRPPTATPQAQAPPLRMRTAETPDRAPPWATVTGVAIISMLVAVASVLWWRPWHARGAAATVGRAASEMATAPGNGPRKMPGDGPPDGRSADREAGSGSIAESTAPGGARTVTAAAAAPADSVPGLGHARLKLSFSADSWVDVRDASGRRLFAGRGHANSVKTIAGAAPMKVYLGFASGVQLEVNNRVVAIGPQFVTGDVARFEAGADGVLRPDLRATAAGDPRPRG